MKKVLYLNRDNRNHDIWNFRPVWLLSEHKNTWRIWSMRNLLTKVVHKQSNGEKVDEL